MVKNYIILINSLPLARCEFPHDHSVIQNDYLTHVRLIPVIALIFVIFSFIQMHILML